MDSKTYWEQREAEALQQRITDEKEYEKRIKQIYDDMLNSVQTEINAFYGKYAYKNGITIAEAKKAVKQADIAAYKFKAKQYVKDAAKDRKANGGKTNKNEYYFSDKANEEMALYNLTMKVNRLEMLKANIGLELIKGHAELETFMNDILQGRTMDELKRQAGILGKTIQNNAQLAHAIVNASFHNATFSDRIWQYQDLMKNQLSSTLQTGLIQGKNPRAIAGELRRYWYGNDPKTGKGAVYCMERLMRTELARVQTEAQKQSFEKNGFEMYTFHTNTGCCDICADLDGKHFKVKDMLPGTNAAPMHPNCRCSCSAYEDSEEYEQWLDFLANGGTTAEYNKLKTAGQKNTIEKSVKNDIIKSKYGFKSIEGEHTAFDDAKVTNPHYREGRIYQINCQRCCPAYEMRRRGYDVEALPYGEANDKAYTGWQKIFENAKWKTIGKNRGKATREAIVDMVANYGSGARLEIYVQWKHGSAHVFMAENIDGKVCFIDPQTGGGDVAHYFEHIKPTRTMVCRIDNLEPTDLIKECCK